MNYKKYTLKNGLRIILAPMQEMGGGIFLAV